CRASTTGRCGPCGTRSRARSTPVAGWGRTTTWSCTSPWAYRGRSWAGRCTKGRSRIPELPEVETVRRELEPWLAGRVLKRVELLAPAGPKYASLERAAGQSVLSVGRRGKFILAPLSAGDELVIHLGMT